MYRFLHLLFTSAVFVALVGCSGSGFGPSIGAHGSGGEPASRAQTPLASSASAINYYNIGSDPNHDVAALDLLYAPDGNLYYTTLGPISCDQFNFCSSTAGAFGQFDPLTHAFTEIDVNGAPQSVYMTPDGAVWGGVNKFLLNQAGALYRFSPFSSAGESKIVLPSESGATPEPRDVTYDSVDQNVYFTDKFGHRVGKIPAAGPFLSSSMTMYHVPRGPQGTPQIVSSPQGITAASDGNVYFGDFNNGTVYQLTTDGTLTAYVTPEQESLGSGNSTDASYARVAPDGRIYVTQLVNAFDAMTTGGAFTPLLIAPGAFPYLERSGSGLVVFDDLGNYAIGTYDVATGETREIPTIEQTDPKSYHEPNGPAATSPTSIWFACDGPPPAGKTLCLGHLTLGTTWAVFPTGTITLDQGASPTQQLIGIAESGSSAPFTVQSANTALVKVTAIAGMDHDFMLSPVGSATGSTTVTVTDVHGVSHLIDVTVVASGSVRRNLERKLLL